MSHPGTAPARPGDTGPKLWPPRPGAQPGEAPPALRAIPPLPAGILARSPPYLSRRAGIPPAQQLREPPPAAQRPPQRGQHGHGHGHGHGPGPGAGAAPARRARPRAPSLGPRWAEGGRLRRRPGRCARLLPPAPSRPPARRRRGRAGRCRSLRSLRAGLGRAPAAAMRLCPARSCCRSAALNPLVITGAAAPPPPPSSCN